MSFKLLINIHIFSFFLLFSHLGNANKRLTENYVSTYKNVAISEMMRTGIPASIKLAQGILESDLGRSPLAYQANNHFGIKCGKDWTGNVYYKHDDDTDSTGVIIESCFRAFANGEESYLAHSEFLTDPAKKSRYGFLFNLGSTDYVGWANGLKFSGYATDPSYPSKLINIIEKFQLFQYDKDVNVVAKVEEVNPEMKPSSKKNQESEIQIVKADQNQKTKKSTPESNRQNDTSASPKKAGYEYGKINELKVIYASGHHSVKDIAHKTGVAVFDILEYNEMLVSKDYIPNYQEIIYLERKKKNIQSNGNDFHTVSNGETMYDIAQKYGIRLESLLAKNNLDAHAEPLAGESISLVMHLHKKDTPRYKMREKFDSYLDMGGLQ